MKWLIKYFDHGYGLGGSIQYHSDRSPSPLTWEKYIEVETESIVMEFYKKMKTDQRTLKMKKM